MSNMSYCRFRNTLTDLRDCQEHMDDADVADSRETEEAQARKGLIRLCVQIAADYGDEV